MGGPAHRLAAIVAAALVLASAAPAAARPRAASWAAPQIGYLLRQGVLPHVASIGAFHPQAPLTAGLLGRMLDALPDARPAPLPEDGSTPLTLHQLNEAFVVALGLRDVAGDVARGLRHAGLRPAPGLGIEVVARTLGLRSDHPEGDDGLELRPDDVATRAEGAYTTWKVLTQSPGAPDYVRGELQDLALPEVPAAARAPLQAALDQVGQPYVWAGAAPADGGFDCSGLVTYAEDGAAWLGGRSSFAMAAATPAGERVGPDQAQAGDLVFFGPDGPTTPASAIDHVGLSLGGRWFVHAANEGVTLDRTDADWYAPRLAFVRHRPAAGDQG